MTKKEEEILNYIKHQLQDLHWEIYDLNNSEDKLLNNEAVDLINRILKNKSKEV